MTGPRSSLAVWSLAMCFAPALVGAQEASSAKALNLLTGFAAGQSADMANANDVADNPGARLTSEPTYDQAARFYAAHLPRFLPGSPKINVRSVPGAASIVAATQLAANPAQSLALVGPAVLYAGITGAARFDPRSLVFIGARQRDDDVCMARGGAAVATIEDARRTPSFVAALTPGSKSALYPRALNRLAGAKFQIIPGYSSAFEVSRALETGEVDVWCGWSLNALRLRHPELLRQGKVRLLVQFSRAAAEARLQIPDASDVVSGAVEREAMRLVEAQTLFSGFALAASERAGPTQIAVWRRAFEAMLGDPEVAADAVRQGIEIDPVPGEAMQAEVDNLLAAGAQTRDILREILRTP